jgi:hypothetical protein
MEIEFIAGAHLYAQIAVGARREVVNGGIIFTVEPQDAGRTDPDARSAPVAKSTIDDLGEPTECAWSFIFAVLVPFQWINEAAALS